MKKLLCLILAFCLFLVAVGCARQADVTDPVTFYYPHKAIDFDSPNGVIASEIRSKDEYDLAQLLALYLRGPKDLSLKHPFPKDTVLVDLIVEGRRLTVILSDEFSSVTGLDRSIAVACLVKTVTELTGAFSVTVRTNDREVNTTLNADQLMLTDPGSDPA